MILAEVGMDLDLSSMGQQRTNLETVGWHFIAPSLISEYGTNYT